MTWVAAPDDLVQQLPQAHTVDGIEFRLSEARLKTGVTLDACDMEVVQRSCGFLSFEDLYDSVRDLRVVAVHIHFSRPPGGSGLECWGFGWEDAQGKGLPCPHPKETCLRITYRAPEGCVPKPRRREPEIGDTVRVLGTAGSRYAGRTGEIIGEARTMAGWQVRLTGEPDVVILELSANQIELAGSTEPVR